MQKFPRGKLHIQRQTPSRTSYFPGAKTQQNFLVSSAQRHSPFRYLHKLQGKLYDAVTTCINTITGSRAQHGPPRRGPASRATIERRHRRAPRAARLIPEVGSARPEVGGQSAAAAMKPAVDEMFPEGAGPYVDLDEVGAEGVGG